MKASQTGASGSKRAAPAPAAAAAKRKRRTAGKSPPAAHDEDADPDYEPGSEDTPDTQSITLSDDEMNGDGEGSELFRESGVLEEEEDEGGEGGEEEEEEEEEDEDEDEGEDEEDEEEDEDEDEDEDDKDDDDDETASHGGRECGRSRKGSRQSIKIYMDIHEKDPSKVENCEFPGGQTSRSQSLPKVKMGNM